MGMAFPVVQCSSEYGRTTAPLVFQEISTVAHMESLPDEGRSGGKQAQTGSTGLGLGLCESLFRRCLGRGSSRGMGELVHPNLPTPQGSLWFLSTSLPWTHPHLEHDKQLYYIILYYTILYYTILYYTILYYTILYYTILYYTILYYTILYYTILYYTILYYTISYSAPYSKPCHSEHGSLCGPWTALVGSARMQS